MGEHTFTQYYPGGQTFIHHHAYEQTFTRNHPYVYEQTFTHNHPSEQTFTIAIVAGAEGRAPARDWQEHDRRNSLILGRILQFKS